MSNRRELKLQYKQAPRAMGVFQVKNTKTGRTFIFSSRNIHAAMNRHRFQLRYGGGKDRELAMERAQYGEESFAIDILELLKTDDEPGKDYEHELEKLEEKWRKAR